MALALAVAVTSSGGGSALGRTAGAPVTNVATNALDPEVDRAFTILDAQPADRAAALDEAFDGVDRQGPDGTWRGDIGGFSPAEILDMHTMSQPVGDSAANAVAKMQREQVFNELVEKVRRDAPDRYVAASFSSTTATIYVTGDAGDFASTERASSVAVNFVGGYQYSESELLEKHREIVEGVDAPDIERLSSELNPKESTVVIRTDQPSKVASSSKSVDLADPADGLQVTVLPSKDVPGEGLDALLRGGGYLGSCTSGFVLRSDYSGTKRLATAAHCGYRQDRVKYQNRNQSAFTTVEYMWRHWGSNGDIAYTSTGAFDPYPSFYAGVSEIRAVRGVTNDFHEGKSFCRFGRTSGNKCSTSRGIFSSRKARSDERDAGKTAHNLVSMNYDRGEGGDSGGPWYSPSQNSAAAGIHSGSNGCWTITVLCDQFTPVSAFHQYGFRVWTL